MYMYRVSRVKKPKHWVYVLIWMEFGLIFSLLLLNFLGLLQAYYGIIPLATLACAAVGYYAYRFLPNDKEEWEKELDEIGKK